MNQLVPLTPGAVPAAFASHAAPLPDMNAAAQQGLLPSFAIIGYKGRNWRLKHRGNEELLRDAQGVPKPTLDVVIVGIAPAISKQFYDKRYAEGDDAAPDCFSNDGVAPDAASTKKQCESCAACPQNVFGSRVTEAGKKAKACQDSRRLAVVPAGDIENDSYDGPMLLRIPPMSLQNLARYTTELARYNAQPYMVKTVLGFDYNVAYPLITFVAGGWVDNAQAAKILDAMQHPSIDRMLTQAVPAEAEAEAPPSALAQGGPPPALAAPVAAPANVQAAPAPVAAPAPTSVAPQVDPAVAAAQKAATAAQAKAEKAAEVARKAMEKAQAELAAALAAATAPPQTAPIVAPQVQSAEPAQPDLPLGGVPTTVLTAPADLESAVNDLLGL